MEEYMQVQFRASLPSTCHCCVPASPLTSGSLHVLFPLPRILNSHIRFAVSLPFFVQKNILARPFPPTFYHLSLHLNTHFFLPFFPIAFTSI